MGTMELQIERLTKLFDDTLAVDIAALVVRTGEFFTVTGPEGSGKSTLLKLIAGHEEPSSGTVCVDGQLLDDFDGSNQPVSFATIADIVSPDRLNVLGRVPFVLFDEPLVALDPASRTSTRMNLIQLHARSEAAFVYATADQEEALSLSDRVAVLRGGKLQQCGTPSEIYREPSNEFVARFFGSQPINLVPAILEKDGAAVEIGNQTVPLAGIIAEEFCRDVTVGIRPEHVRLNLDTTSGWRGRVVSAHPYGDVTHVKVEIEGIKLCALASTQPIVQVGDSVIVRIAPTHLIVFDDQGVRLDQL